MYNGMQNGSAGARPGDEKLLVLFKPGSLENKAKSLIAGAPQFDDVDFIVIMAPGEKDPIFEGKVRETDKSRFSRAWEAYKQKREAPVNGMPIEQWPLISAARVSELKAVGVPTVEALANVTDERLRNLGMGARDLRQKAIDFLAAAKSSAPLAQMREEIESIKLLLKQKDEAIAALQAEVSKRKEPTLEESYVAAIEPKKTKGKKVEV